MTTDTLNPDPYAATYADLEPDQADRLVEIARGIGAGTWRHSDTTVQVRYLDERTGRRLDEIVARGVTEADLEAVRRPSQLAAFALDLHPNRDRMLAADRDELLARAAAARDAARQACELAEKITDARTGLEDALTAEGPIRDRITDLPETLSHLLEAAPTALATAAAILDHVEIAADRDAAAVQDLLDELPEHLRPRPTTRDLLDSIETRR